MSEPTEKQGHWITVQDVVKDLDVHEATVRRWIKAGELAAVKMGNKAGYRIWSTDYDQFISDRLTKKAVA
jgi:excisionase family DNA binding protein